VTRPSLRQRSHELEILDGAGVAEEVRERCYRELATTHRWLGNHAAVIKLLRRDASTVKSVLDIGCGHGAFLCELRRKCEVEAIGVDLNPPQRSLPVRILRGDAVCDRLPAADVAVSIAVVHHLPAGEVARLIENVGRSCRRFIILDFVRHRCPLLLFRTFVAPFVNSINARDGIRSLERAFTPAELNRIVTESLAHTGARFRHTVSPLYTRQIVDISY
jgi:SAM-dependent methyltransferase